MCIHSVLDRRCGWVDSLCENKEWEQMLIHRYVLSNICENIYEPVVL